MLNFFSKRHNRVEVQGSKIFIDNQRNNVGKEFEQELVFSLETSTPEIIAYENDTILRSFRIEPLLSNKDLAGQFLHSSIRVLSSNAVMIDGIISRSAKTWNRAGNRRMTFKGKPHMALTEIGVLPHKR